MMFFNRDFAIQSDSRRLCTIYKSKIRFPSSCPDTKLSKASSIRTFLCVEKLRTAPACIRPDISAVRPDDTQCSTSYGISFQNTVMGRLLQPSGQRGFPSGRAHPLGKYHIQNPDVWTREHQIWKLHASDQPSGRPSPWSGRTKPWYGNYLQRKCDHPDNRAPPSGRGSNQERISVKFLESQSHSCPSRPPMTTVRMALT